MKVKPASHGPQGFPSGSLGRTRTSSSGRRTKKSPSAKKEVNMDYVLKMSSRVNNRGAKAAKKLEKEREAEEFRRKAERTKRKRRYAKQKAANKRRAEKAAANRTEA